MSREYGKFYTRLADLLTVEKNLSKSTAMDLLRAKLSFKLLRSVNICIRDYGATNINEIKKNYADDANDIEYVYEISMNEE